MALVNPWDMKEYTIFAVTRVGRKCPLSRYMSDFDLIAGNGQKDIFSVENEIVCRMKLMTWIFALP